MNRNKSKTEILDDISKKEFFDERHDYAHFFEYWYDGGFDGEDYYDYHYGDYFYDWLNDPSRLRDEKLDELLDLSKKNRLGDFFPKDFDDK